MYDIQTKVLNEYDELRSKAENERRKRIDEIYNRFGRIKEIDNDINRIGFSTINNITKNPQNAEKYKAEMQKSIRALDCEKKRILAENGYPPDYTKVRYECNKCGDTGYIGSKKCSCFINRLIKESYAASNIPNLENYIMEDFRLDYYSRSIMPDENISPYERMKGIKEIAADFCDNFDCETRGLLFCGKPGLGKTYLSKCIAKKMADKGKTVIYTTSIGLINVFYDFQFGRENDSTQKELLYTSDLLIIDDLGTEAETKNTLPYLFDILDTRISRGKKMIINTNHTLKAITNRYSERFSSRLFGNFKILKFLGTDIRIMID